MCTEGGMHASHATVVNTEAMHESVMIGEVN